MGELLGGDGFEGADEVGLLGEHANEGDDRVIGAAVMGEGRGKIGDEIHGDVGPGARGNRMGLEEAGRGLGGRFDALAGGAGGDVGAYSAGHAGPPEVGGDGIEGFQVAWVAGCGGVMEFEEEAATE